MVSSSSDTEFMFSLAAIKNDTFSSELVRIVFGTVLRVYCYGNISSLSLLGKNLVDSAMRQAIGEFLSSVFVPASGYYSLSFLLIKLSVRR